MSQLELISNPRLLLALPAVSFLIADDIETARYRAMADDYRRACASRPGMKHCTIAFMVGAKAFGISAAALLSDDKKRGLCADRQKLMAFSRIVSVGTPVVNPWKGIGRAFMRHHATVIHATHKYGAQIAAAIQEAAT